MKTHTRYLLLCGSAALVLATAPANGDSLQASTGQVVALSGPRVSVLDAARTVVTFEAAGDIRGMLTLNLVGGSAGTAPLTGEWSLVSRYVDDMVGGGDRPAPAGDDPEHDEYIEFVERGTVGGTVAGGILGFDTNGRLESLESLRLRVAGGYLEFQGATGSGSASASNLQDVSNGSGTLVLALEVRR